MITESTRERWPLLRRSVSVRIAQLIFRRKCLHIDAWLYQLADDSILFVLQESAGGRDIISRKALFVAGNGRYIIGKVPDLSQAIERKINHPWARAKSYLNNIHWRVIYPLLRQPRAEYAFPYSIALHYVWLGMAGLDEPCAGTLNHWLATKRGQRYGEPSAAMLARTDPALTAGDAKPGARDRSILRTLDKLLK